MATKKITDLVELISAASGDVLPIVDISDDITKKIQVNNLLASKQDTLVSGTNIKTLNSESLLGSGNIEITASPSGVGGAIQFSDGSAFASDAANLFWDDTNNRLGVGTNAPTLPIDILGGTSNGGLKVRAGNTTSQNILDIANNAGTKGWVYRAGDGVLQFYGGNFQIESQSSSGHIVLATGNGSGGVGINVSSPSARLHIKGSGTTSATTSLLVQNSGGTAAMTVKDDLSTSVKTLYIDNAIEGATSGRMSIISQYDLAIRPNNGGVGFAEGFGFNVNSSALIEMQSTTKGFLPPRMTTTQKNAISSPASGLMVYDTDTNKLCCYNGTSWNDLF
jgi:hypothetical protein